jgi:hypothetical protein
MISKGPFFVSWGVLALGIAAGLALLAGARSSSRQEQRSEEFQRLVGGLGLGPALDLSRCPFCFDPRVSFCCKQECGPVPGGIDFCPHHACSIFYYPPLTRRNPKDEP